DIVSALYQDRDGRLWVGTQRGLAVFDAVSETFTRVTGIYERVTSIAEDQAGTLWVATEGEGLFEGARGETAFNAHRPDPADRGSLASFAVSQLLCDTKGRLWIGTRDGGVDELDPARPERPRRFRPH